MQAVVKIGASQYLVSPGLVITTDRIESDQKQLTLDQILLVIDDKEVQIGKPFVPGYHVVGEILDQIKGPKVRVSKYKAKSRYRKNRGFRAFLTRIRIVEVSASKNQEKPTIKRKLRETVS
jgi:large subunit ribosomal protein L21